MQLLYQIVLIGRRDLPLSPDAHAGFDMILLRMLAFLPATNNIISASLQAAPPTKITSPIVASPATTATASPAPKNLADESLSSMRSNFDFLKEKKKTPLVTKATIQTAPSPIAAPQATRPPEYMPSMPKDMPPSPPPEYAEYPNYDSPPMADFAPPSATIAETPPQPMQSPVVETVPPSKDALAWLALYETLPISGGVKALAGHSVLLKQDATHLHLRCAQAAMRTEAREHGLIEGLQAHFSEDFKLNLEIAAFEALQVQQTPVALQQLRQKARQTAAVQALETDKVVLALQQHFAANIDMNSISYPDDFMKDFEF